MEILQEYEKAFNECCKELAKAIKEAILKTEKQTKRKLTKKEKDLCIKIGVNYLYYKALKNKNEP